MSLTIALVGHLLAIGAALVAIVGNTWDREKVGIRRVTGMGWAAAAIAFLGLGISIFTTVSEHNRNSAYEEIALKDVRGGWRQMLIPWTLAEWEVTGTEGNVSLAAIDRLMQMDLRRKLDKLDYTKPSKVPQYGQWSLGALLCRRTRIGARIMESAVNTYSTVIAPEIVTGVKYLRQSQVFGKLIAAGCGTSAKSEPDLRILNGLFTSKEVGNYLVLMRTLGENLGDPGRKRRNR